MIEIFAIYMFCKKLGVILRKKGRNPVGMQFLLVVLWFVGEFTGGVAAMAFAAIASGGFREGVTGAAYFGALLGAACSTTIVFIIAHYIQPRADLAQTHGFPVEKVAAAPENPYANTESMNP